MSQTSSAGTSGAGEVGSGRCWEQRQRRRLEDEEGAGAALSVLRVVPTLPKCHHQEVTQEGPTSGTMAKETATFGENSISIKKKSINKKCRPGRMGTPKPRFRLPSDISGREINEVDPYLLFVLLRVRECARRLCHGSEEVRGW